MELDSDWRELSVLDKHVHLFNSKIFSDVIFLVGDKKEPIHAHKFILILSSPVFEVQFGERWEQENKIEIPDVSSNAFRLFLQYLYTDKFSVTENEAADVLSLAHKYMKKYLAKKCFDLLASVINVSNVLHIHQTAMKFNEKNLAKKGMKFILENGSAVMEDIGFSQIETDTLKMILESEKLVAEEIEIFRAVMRWAENRCDVLGFDCSIENKRLVIKDLIYLIRFTLMTSEDFTNEVTSGKHEGILSESESISIYKYLTAGSSMRSHFPILPFNTKKRCSEIDYMVDVLYDTRDGNHVCLRYTWTRHHFETTLGFRSNRNICVKGIELRSPTRSKSTYLAFAPSGSNNTAESEIFALLISMSGTSPVQKKLFGIFTESSLENEFESGVQIEKNVNYNLNVVIKVRQGGNDLLMPSHEMNSDHPTKVSCQESNVEFTFTAVSCRSCRQRQEIKLFLQEPIKSIHFTI